MKNLVIVAKLVPIPVRLSKGATFSMSSKTKPWLWELLSRCTHYQCWKAAVSPKGFHVSVSKSEKLDKLKKHKLLTNAIVSSSRVVLAFVVL